MTTAWCGFNGGFSCDDDVSDGVINTCGLTAAKTLMGVIQSN